MRTITTNIYKFDELADKAKAKAREWYRINESHDFSEEVDCFNAILAAFDADGKIEQDSYGNWLLELKPNLDEDEDSLVGVRALKWVWNNWIEPNMKGKYYGKLYAVEKSLEHPTGWIHKKRYSKATREWDCPLTGFCMDMIPWEAYKAMQEATKKGERWTIGDYMKVVLDRFTKELEAQSEYMDSDEYIDEMLEVNNYEFYEDGRAFA